MPHKKKTSNNTGSSKNKSTNKKLFTEINEENAHLFFCSNDILDEYSFIESCSESYRDLGLFGPYDGSFISEIDEVKRIGQQNLSQIGVTGLVSYKFFLQNKKKIDEKFFSNDDSSFLKKFQNNLLSPEIELFNELSQKETIIHFRLIVLHDVEKQDISFGSTINNITYVDKKYYDRYKVQILLKHLAESCNDFRMIERMISSQLTNREVFDVGLQISQEKDTAKILHSILDNSMKLTKADSGSIAIIGLDKDLKKTSSDVLTYFVTINHSKEIHFNRFSMELSMKSLAGYAALTKETLSIEDTYTLEQHVPYSFNKAFDQKTNFRTKSMLVIPMINRNKSQSIGVIQLLNKKRHFETILDYNNFREEDILSFDEEDQMKIRSLASFANIALENAMLTDEIDQLFLGFVEASVSAVEQRDPATSGHSSRVAKYTIELARTCISQGQVFRRFHFSQEQLKELEYAALLHDFGKIGVQENILVKAKKIELGEMKNILKRLEILVLKRQLEYEKKKVSFLLDNNKLSKDEKKKWLILENVKLQQEIEDIKKYRFSIIKANEPTILEQDTEIQLDRIKNTWIATEYSYERVLTDQEYELLGIRKGSLSPLERKEIESHVTHTYNFLKKIPWTSKLGDVPEIALSHHEKLDGSGYPHGIRSSEIPPQTKLITVCDIFDALVASDRPYKRSVSKERAFEILHLEANEGKIEPLLVELFINQNIYRVIGTHR